MNTDGTFHTFMARAARAGELVVQPRMGFGTVGRMRAGLLATRDAGPRTIGTLTLDSYTRIGDFAAAARAIHAGDELNGYPIVNLGPQVTKEMLDGVRTPAFPVQVRHGSATPGPIIDALVAAGLDATEGGPISYCLPYGRTPVNRSVAAWREATRRFAELASTGATPHLESFGGCMLGQLCPPSLLVAISVLEGMFFAQNGITSVSLSYAQQTHPGQDEEAVRALHDIAADLLPGISWHVVIYAYMGLYPATRRGSLELLAAAARLARRGGATRLIVKTPAESSQIPSIEDNVTALRVAAAAAAAVTRSATEPECTGIEAEARQIITRVLDLHDDIGRALTAACALGFLDVPYCLHPDNGGRTRSYIAGDGHLRWAATGTLPVLEPTGRTGSHRMTSAELLRSLSYVRNRYDATAGRQKEPLS
ncbi:methylaspartate mutase [Actinophytocola oryzae]|uniref:Glutamate mutase subunit E n=1 Tax=Actinophytocola oryzae TaxID=502181 RepID=A0A4V3FT46_9PSEU|nr:methylaspartate mutase [Actinophytocola oryzae]TDV49931.1 glutamate mutase subunit E [Actinophytocola oryzae]